MEQNKIKTEQKALEINLNDKIYGTFAEIGAGQEVARNFFQVGAAVGTIAKTMSAYDKTYSDAIYGVEKSGRYVCESRVYKMLDHEYELMEERLIKTQSDTNFFVFADTVSAINYQKTIKGHGWLGLRFQLSPNGEPNNFVLHVKMKDNNNRLQQEAIGVLGVNMLYAAYFINKNIEQFVISLLDGLKDRVEIDMIRLNGPDFKHVDNRLLSLYLVKNGLSEVSMFDKHGKTIHASEFLYKKALLVVRGNFRPPTLVTLDVFKTSYKQFLDDIQLEKDNCKMITELTLENINSNGEINEKDFLDRADLLCALGENVIISHGNNHQILINYLADYKIQKLGLVTGVKEMSDIINAKYLRNQDGRLLVAFGEIFTRNIKLYVYPASQENTTELMTASNMPVPEGIKFLYKYLLESKHIEGIKGYNADLLYISPVNIHQEISEGKTGWEDQLPEVLVTLIKEKGIFGYPIEKLK